MPPLPTQLRNRLEAAVKQARRTAEAAAKVALERLTVGNAEPGSHLSVEERQLRNRLRAHGRQLGDQRDPKTGTQSINRLIRECAYEHWHRMLFARFLAENHLLMHPDGVPVSLAECDELAREKSADDADSRRSEEEEKLNLRKSAQSVDGWTLAARYAARMLPQVFRPNDPMLQIKFAPEHKLALEKLITELPVEVFTAEDSLGWVYQFWQAERKEEVNAFGDKITGETLPAVTQLFTEHYMVLFLLHNTIGAWWAARLLSADDTDLHRLETEEEVRKAVSLPGYEFCYLRFIREEVQPKQEEEKENLRSSAQSADKKYRWKPAAGSFPGWPKSLKDFKLLDPCCGSGHFLVAAFDLLARLRMVDEGLSAQDACDAVLRENIHGLEIDPRCTQIAAFNLALAAWKFPALSADDADSHRLNSNGENNLRQSAQSADALGFRPLPPLNIACCGIAPNAKKEDWLALANGDTRLRSGLEQLYDLFQKAPELGSLINPRRLAHGDLVTASFAEIQQLLTKALQSERARRNDDLNEIGVAAQGMAKVAEILAGQFTLVATNVPYLGRGKQDDVLKDFCERHHPDAKADLATCFVERCLDFCTTGGSATLVTPQNWLFLNRFKHLRKRLLEVRTWHAVTRLGERGFNSPQAAGAFTAMVLMSATSPHSEAAFVGFDVADEKGPDEKAIALLNCKAAVARQRDSLHQPDSIVTFEAVSSLPLLSEYADSLQGACTLDIERFRHYFWELERVTKQWNLHSSSPDGGRHFSGMEYVSFTREEGGALAALAAAMKEEGFLGGWLSGNKVWGKRGVACSWMRQLPTSLYLGTVYDHSAVAVVPHDEKLLPAIWCFCSSPEYREQVRKIDQKLQVANKTLAKVPFDLAYWQKVASEKYPHGLPKPYTDDPTQWLFDGHPARNPEDQARLAQDPATHPLLLEPDGTLSPCPSARKPYVLQVAVARLLGYQWPRQTGSNILDCPALGPDGLEQFADEDGIVCIPSVRSELPAAERLRTLLVAAYGKAWSPTLLDELLSAADYAGSSLEDWLRNGFFEQHCKLFHHRPFIWQIWDGRKDGFSALVNYHKLDHKLLEKLTYTYLGDWIKKQQEAVDNGESGADDRLLKAQQLQNKLKLILEGEAPYDIFVRWKPLEQQPIGWNPDLNDGVRLNIRPFVIADVLRKRPNVKWGKDRGKNPPGSPWGEVRDNDRHLTLAEKRKARET